MIDTPKGPVVVIGAGSGITVILSGAAIEAPDDPVTTVAEPDTWGLPGVIVETPAGPLTMTGGASAVVEDPPAISVEIPDDPPAPVVDPDT